MLNFAGCNGCTIRVIKIASFNNSKQAMKKLSLNFLLMLGLMASLFFACGDDDEGDDTPAPVAPTVTSLTPNTGPVGTEVTIAGTNFGTSPTVSFGGTNAPVKSGGSATSIKVDVPAGLATGAANVTVSANSLTSIASVFTVTEDDPEPPAGPPTAGTALDTIAALSTLNAAVDALSLTKTLDDAAKVTIFAPRNAAFDSLLKYQDVADLTALVSALTAEGVTGILQAHIVADSLPADLLEAKAYPTLNASSTVTITKEGDNVFANGAQVVQPNIIVGNGVIHIIDSVINIDARAVVPDQAGVVRVASSTDGVGNVTWTANNIYILDGFVFVNDGQTLKIDAGTVIKGRPGQAARASALIVARGGKIEANGTATAPIIFTGEADDLNGSVANDATRLWGGVIVLGKAPTNNNDTQGVKNIEGIPTEEARGVYGGTDAADNSGFLRYVSIRHGGSVIGANNEINGLTLGAVGNGTEVNNVEVWSNVDDGIEFFGGTVNATNLIVAYPGDDGLDADEGYSGNVQNAIVWQTSPTMQSSDPRAMELDGGVSANEDVEPYSLPIFANLTLVYDEGDEDMENAIVFRDNSSASIYNSFIVGQDAPVSLERLTNKGSSYDRYSDSTLVMKGNVFYNVAGVTDAANFANLFVIDGEKDPAIEATVEAELARNNTVANPTFGTGAARFTPTASFTEDLATLPTEPGLAASTYRGAVDPTAGATPYFANWSKTWAVIQ